MPTVKIKFILLQSNQLFEISVELVNCHSYMKETSVPRFRLEVSSGNTVKVPTLRKCE